MYTFYTIIHIGHLSLVKEARENNDVVIASIYVNPTQFGPNDDLDKYPRRLERDTDLLNDMGVDHLFAPSEMYGKDHVCYVEPQVSAENKLCANTLSYKHVYRFETFIGFYYSIPTLVYLLTFCSI